MAHFPVVVQFPIGCVIEYQFQSEYASLHYYAEPRMDNRSANL